ncbi:MAG: metalloregulator ArsR/SmtB family transcription factor [Planctomycetes bacterium]|nr:metalloregulator ArsR/SmtB family transcription factor [Planctomycetota bacterium]
MEPEVVFKAMGDRTRQRTLTLLTHQELSVSELVELLRQPQSTVSRHLKILRQAGLIRDRRNGNTVLYSLPGPQGDGTDAELTDQLLKWMADQPPEPGLEVRIQTVVDRRRQMSDRFFTEVGRHWDALREESFGDRFHLEAFIALLPSHWQVLDVGAGTGYLLPILARQFVHVVGLDPVEAMLESARQRVSTHSLDNVTLCRGDLSKLPMTSSAVDLAVAVLVLHHVASPHDAVKELHRVLCCGGQVLIVEQKAHHCDAFLNRMQDRWWGFEPQELDAMLTSAGFRKVRSRLLRTVERSADAPELFVVTGTKTAEPDDRDR